MEDRGGEGGTKTPSVLVEADGVARAGWGELAAVDFSSPLGWLLVSPPRTRPCAFGIGTGARGPVRPVVVCSRLLSWAWALGIQKPMGRGSVTGPRTKHSRSPKKKSTVGLRPAGSVKKWKKMHE